MQVISAHGNVGALSENIAGALAYLTIFPAILFLSLQPYRRNPFVRFHAFQCLLFTAAVMLIALALRVAGYALFVIPVLGPLLVVVIDVVAGLAAVFVWFVLAIKAVQGEAFKLPVLGDYAQHYAGNL